MIKLDDAANRSMENADGSRMSTPRAESHDHSEQLVTADSVKAWPYSGPDDMGPRFPRVDDMSAKHTPGPWSVGSHRSIQSASGTICETYSHMGIAEADSNERLIATSPTMYEYIVRRAEIGDSEAKSILETINASR